MSHSKVATGVHVGKYVLYLIADDFDDLLLVEEVDFSLRRVDIDIDFLGGKIDAQIDPWVPTTGQQRGIQRKEGSF